MGPALFFCHPEETRIGWLMGSNPIDRMPKFFAGRFESKEIEQEEAEATEE